MGMVFARILNSMAFTRLDDARTRRDALNKRIADAKADILELLAARGLLNWPDAGLANGHLSDMMSDITDAERSAIDAELSDADNDVCRIEGRDLRRSSPVTI